MSHHRSVRDAHALPGRAVTAISRADLDITDLDAVRVAVAGHHVVINASAYQGWMMRSPTNLMLSP
jgi:dTDP-4-dehydrorhamnose reductase